MTGLILTRKAVEFAYAERGYVAFGGEWLVLPVMMMMVHIVRDVRSSFSTTFGEEVDDCDRRTSKHHRRMAK